MAVVVDFSQLKDLEKRLSEANQSQNEFFESCAKELTARLLRKVIKRTPVGTYPDRVGGTLRRGWTGGVDAKTFADSLSIRKNGNSYTITLTNNVEYAPYVEYGHRTRGRGGWVEGRHMLTISEHEINMQSDAIIRKKLEDFLRGVMK